MNLLKIAFFTLLFIGCNNINLKKFSPENEHKSLGLLDQPQEAKDIIGPKKFTLDDFYSNDSILLNKVDNVFNSLKVNERVAQMIITSSGKLGKSNKVVKKLVDKNNVGGVIFLGGTKKSLKDFIFKLNEISKNKNHLPLIYSIDAEPTLFNNRIKGTLKICNTSEIKTPKECDSIVKLINRELISIGIHQNLAPVCDISNQNEVIKNRSFGSDINNVIELSNQFISSTQSDNIIATAKHFPGHGLVKGDTHKQSVYIEGELRELEVYKSIIKSDVISIMISHITIKNNYKYGTNNLPSSCSKKIVTELLRNKMGFKGIIISDALNVMKAVNEIENAPLLASKAGCDMILMPKDELKTIKLILKEMEQNETYRKQVCQSVKKIIRLKVCLGLI